MKLWNSLLFGYILLAILCGFGGVGLWENAKDKIVVAAERDGEIKATVGILITLDPKGLSEVRI